MRASDDRRARLEQLLTRIRDELVEMGHTRTSVELLDLAGLLSVREITMRRRLRNDLVRYGHSRDVVDALDLEQLEVLKARSVKHLMTTAGPRSA